MRKNAAIQRDESIGTNDMFCLILKTIKIILLKRRMVPHFYLPEDSSNFQQHTL